MNNRTSLYNELPSTILAALAKLDQKGSDERITQAMTIVYDAFRFTAEKRPFSADDLLVLATIDDQPIAFD